MGSYNYPVFSGCSNLTAVNIGELVKTIPAYAFYDCTGLTEIHCHATTPPTISGKTFSDYSATLYVPVKSMDAYKSAKYWNCFAINKYFVDGMYYNILSTTDVEVTYKDDNYNSYSGEINIPETVEVKGGTYNVTSIGAEAFKGCIDLKEIAISNSVKRIGNNAFDGCSGLRKVTIGSGVTEIGDYAFDKCDRIKDVYVYPAVPPTIGLHTFTAYVKDNATLHVVKGCKDAYADAKYWKYFLNITDDLISADFIVSESIVLDHTNITAIEGETYVLTATIYPEDATEKAVEWSVSDKNVVSIKPLDNVSAKVTVLKEGTATITATTIDGSNLKATCKINVLSDIENVVVDELPAEYYDLNGFRVKNPTHGIYIMKQGSTVRKVVL